MNKFKNLIYIFIITLIVFIFTDFIFGKTLSSLLKIENIENIYRIQNNYYSYTFKKILKLIQLHGVKNIINFALIIWV